MKGIGGRQFRGLPTGARILVADNSGAKMVMLIAVPGYKGVHRRLPAAGLGDLITATVKKGTPEMRRQVVNAVVIRCRRAQRRADGTMIMFEDNAVVLTNEKGETRGSDIKGPVSREAAERWPRIAANASAII